MSLLERFERALGWAALRLFAFALLTTLVLWLASLADEWVKKELGAE
jgi:hypothetical protein